MAKALNESLQKLPDILAKEFDAKKYECGLHRLSLSLRLDKTADNGGHPSSLVAPGAG